MKSMNTVINEYDMRVHLKNKNRDIIWKWQVPPKSCLVNEKIPFPKRTIVIPKITA